MPIGNCCTNSHQYSTAPDLARQKWENLVSHTDLSHRCSAPFKYFLDFASRHTSVHAAAVSRGSLGSIARLTKSVNNNTFTVGLLLINSAWLCGHFKHRGHVFDYGNLRLTEFQINSLIEDVKDCDLRIAVLHHPLYWMQEHDHARAERLLTDHCHLVLHGHEHRPRVNIVESSAGSVVYIPGGSAYNRRLPTDRCYNNSYNLTHVDLRSGRGFVFLRRWDDEAPNKWVKDRRHWPDGIAQFVIPERDERKKRLLRRWHTRISDNYRRFFDVRPFDRAVMTFKQRRCEIAEVPLETTVRWDLLFEEGPRYDFQVHSNLSEHMEGRLDDVFLNEMFGGVVFKVDGVPQSVPAWENAELRFRCSVPEAKCRVELMYVWPSLERDVWAVTLKRFANEVEMEVIEAEGFRYGYTSIGGFPAPMPKRDTVTGTMRTSCRECLPEQGFLINWWRPQEEVEQLPDGVSS